MSKKTILFLFVFLLTLSSKGFAYDITVSHLQYSGFLQEVTCPKNDPNYALCISGGNQWLESLRNTWTNDPNWASLLEIQINSFDIGNVTYIRMDHWSYIDSILGIDPANPVLDLGPYFSGDNPYAPKKIRLRRSGDGSCINNIGSINCTAVMGVRADASDVVTPFSMIIPQADIYSFQANAGGLNFDSFMFSGTEDNVTLHTFNGALDRLVATNTTYSFGSGGIDRFTITDPPIVSLTFNGIGIDEPVIDFTLEILSSPGTSPAPVPEPSTLVLLGAGLGGVALFRRFRKK